jgi:hypothetical protein
MDTAAVDQQSGHDLTSILGDLGGTRKPGDGFAIVFDFVCQYFFPETNLFYV